MIPLAIYLATGPTILGFHFNAWSVFGIFLFADILAAATVAPVLLTLWGGVATRGAPSWIRPRSAFGCCHGSLRVPKDFSFLHL